MNLINDVYGMLFRPFRAQIWHWSSPQGVALGYPITPLRGSGTLATVMPRLSQGVLKVLG